MFSRKSDRIQQLEAHLQDAHIELARVKSSPYFQIAENLAEGARDNLDELSVEDAVQQAILVERERLRAQFMGTIVTKQVKERLEDEKEVLRRQAEAAAASLAEQQLQEFRTTEGPVFLREATTKLQKTKFRFLVEQEKEALRRQAMEQLRATAAQTAADEFANEDPREDKEYNKARAAELRKITKRTHLLDLTGLEFNDRLEIVFTKKGAGNEPYTESDGYGGSYGRPELIARSLKVRIADATTGVAIVDEDSWQVDGVKGGLYPMTPVSLACYDPVKRVMTHSINKAAPLYMRDLATDEACLGDGNLEVWYATLNEYKALS